MSKLREEVRSRYADAARVVTERGALAEDLPSGCCGSTEGSCCGDSARSLGSGLYDLSEREQLPDTAVLASLGCGNPTAVAELYEGETVLDLGSGGGIDALLSARRVGPKGKVYGLDMTDEMLALALRNKAEASADNVEFLKGYIEAVPLPAETIDVVISNCVINLSTDKPSVFAEMFRILRPGGRIGVTDVVASDDLTPAARAERGSYVGCIAGALSFTEYRTGLEAAGFTDIAVESTHEVNDGMHSAIVQATKPVS
jgi:arsenite methyltransferase